MTILKVKVFNDTEEFEEWQKEVPRNITSVNPILLSMDAKTDTAGENITANLNFCISVIYFEDWTN